MYMKKDLLELYELIDQYHERKINHTDFYFALLDNINPLQDENERTCEEFATNFNQKKSRMKIGKSC